MDWNVMAQYLPQYEKAAWLTLRLGVAGIFWAILVGLVCAVLQYEKVPVLRRIVGLAFLGGSYMAEAFRSGLEAIEPIQTESALSLGMRRRRSLCSCSGARPR